MVGKKTRKTKEETLFQETVAPQDVEDAVCAPSRAHAAKPMHVEPAGIIASLNDAVSGINAVFQLRDGLLTEVALIKDELRIAKDVRVEEERIEALKRTQENFQYDFNIRKERMEQELECLESERREKIQRMEEDAKKALKSEAEEQAARLKLEASSHALKLKMERDDHDRKIKLEKEDFERTRTLFEQERLAFETRIKSFEAEKAAMRDRLVSELNHDNEHELKVTVLNHQREVEILRSQLKLEQAGATKFEVLLKDSRVQNDKLADQLSTLSREALASASSSSMAVKLKEIISQMAPGGSSQRGA